MAPPLPPTASSKPTFSLSETDQIVDILLDDEPVIGPFWAKNARLTYAATPQRPIGALHATLPLPTTTLGSKLSSDFVLPSVANGFFFQITNDQSPFDIANKALDLLESIRDPAANAEPFSEIDGSTEQGTPLAALFQEFGTFLLDRFLEPVMPLGAPLVALAAAPAYRRNFFEQMGEAFLNALSVNTTEKERASVGVIIDLIRNATMPDGRKAWEIHHKLYQQGKSFAAWIEKYAPKDTNVHDTKNLVAVPNPVHAQISAEQTTFWEKIMKKEKIDGFSYDKLFEKLGKDPKRSAEVMTEYQKEMKRITNK